MPAVLSQGSRWWCPQVIACAGDAFYIDRSFSKREYELIFGGVLMIFAFVPVSPCSDAFQAMHGLWVKNVHVQL